MAYIFNILHILIKYCTCLRCCLLTLSVYSHFFLRSLLYHWEQKIKSTFYRLACNQRTGHNLDSVFLIHLCEMRKAEGQRRQHFNSSANLQVIFSRLQFQQAKPMSASLSTSFLSVGRSMPIVVVSVTIGTSWLMPWQQCLFFLHRWGFMYGPYCFFWNFQGKEFRKSFFYCMPEHPLQNKE